MVVYFKVTLFQVNNDGNFVPLDSLHMHIFKVVAHPPVSWYVSKPRQGTNPSCPRLFPGVVGLSTAALSGPHVIYFLLSVLNR